MSAEFWFGVCACIFAQIAAVTVLFLGLLVWGKVDRKRTVEWWKENQQQSKQSHNVIRLH